MDKELGVKLSGTKMRSFEKKQSFYGKHAKTIFPLLLILPTVLFLITFSFFPTLRGFTFALTNRNRMNPGATEFVGLQNFVQIFTQDEVFWGSLATSVSWLFWQVGLQLLFGMLFALILNQAFRGRGLARTLCFAPWAVSGVLTTMLWMLIFNEHIGLLNELLRMIGLDNLTRAWVQNPQSAFPSVVVAGLWRGIPFFAITLLGGLQTIPTELYESARVDGGNAWNNYWRITLPCMKESIVFATLMRMIWEFRTLDLIMTMTGGGPVRRTLVLPIYMYQVSIEQGRHGYGAALTVVLFLIMSIFTVFYLKINNFGKGVND